MSVRELVICSSERTGSTLLSQLLRDLGVIAFGHELFEDNYVMDEIVFARLPGWNLEVAKANPLRYVEAVRRNWADPSKSLAVKIHWFSYEKWRPLGLDLLRFFQSPRFIFCTRGNIAMQAISSVRASQTESWYWEKLPKRTPEYDFAAIRDRIALLAYQNVCWEEYFRANEITPFRCVYESLDHDFKGVLRHLFHWLGQDVPENRLSALTPRMKRQRDETNYAWLRQYWADLGAAS